MGSVDIASGCHVCPALAEDQDDLATHSHNCAPFADLRRKRTPKPVDPSGHHLLLKITRGALNKFKPPRLKLVNREVVEPNSATSGRAASHHENGGSSKLYAIGDGVARL